ncbi:MAG: thioredoxin fold domain-containing protein [Arenicellales bacterium]
MPIRARLCTCCVAILLALLVPGPTHAEENSSGTFMGAMDTTHPTWFKESFLDFEEDIAQATTEGKRLVLYFWQAGCPYCNALVEHNFTQRDITQTMREHFDLVAINMWGDREIVQVGGREFNEKTLASALKVQYTPTLLFFDEARKVILRLNGYYPPDDFRKALAYAGNQGEKHGTFADYLANQPGSSAHTALHTEEFFEAPPYDLSLQDGRALAIYFEQGQCRECDTLHLQLLSQPIVRVQATKMRAVQLDMWSETLLITPDGRKLSARAFAHELNVQFAPTVVFFNAKGTEVMRLDGAFRAFHTQGIMRYVNDRAYEHEPSFQRYLGEYAEHLRAQGFDVDIWSYEQPVSRNGQAALID